MDNLKKEENRIDKLELNLENIENINEVLTREELDEINSLFISLENFSQIIDDIENIINKNDLNEKSVAKLFTLILNIREKRNVQLPAKSDRMGLMKTFFELPEILRAHAHILLKE